MPNQFHYRAEHLHLEFTYAASPIGDLLLAGCQGELHLLGFPEGKMALKANPGWQENAAPFRSVITQLNEYFAGDRQNFEVALAPQGTNFQLQVWMALRQIPYGETRSYSDIARSIGLPKAMRAVGAANGRNPLPIIVPCHRVIGANGSLTGFGGGINAKRTLLSLEQKHKGLFAQT